MIKRLTSSIAATAAGGGLLILVGVALAVLTDHLGVALLGVALLQLLVLGVALLTLRRTSALADGRAAAVAEITRAISNMGLRSVDETRASARELAARLDSL